MKIKLDRFKHIREIISEQKISNQDDLLKILVSKGFTLTQATLSRDLKKLKIIKTPDDNGGYFYALPNAVSYTLHKSEATILGDNSLEFSGPLAVIKTKSGYASPIAAEIDERGTEAIMGTIAGDDTILIIPREGFTRAEITEILSNIIK